jgi:hypothetical protein
MRAFLQALLLLIACSASAADRFGNMIFETPEGWSRVQQADALLLIPRDVPEGYVLTMTLRKGEDLGDRTLRQYLDDMLRRELDAGARVLNSAPVQESKIASGAPVLTTTRVMVSQKGLHYLSQYFAFAAGLRGEMVSLVSSSEELAKKYSEVIGKFVATLQFANLQPQE